MSSLLKQKITDNRIDFRDIFARKVLQNHHENRLRFGERRKPTRSRVGGMRPGYDGTLTAMLCTLVQPLETVRPLGLRHHGNIPGRRIQALKRCYRACLVGVGQLRVAMYRTISAGLKVLQVIRKQPGNKGKVLRLTAVVRTWKDKPTPSGVGR